MESGICGHVFIILDESIYITYIKILIYILYKIYFYILYFIFYKFILYKFYIL